MDRGIATVGNGEGRLDHLGIHVDSSEELDFLADLKRGMNRPLPAVQQATCCYANMEEAWVKGTAGERWEASLTHRHDDDHHGEDREHLLGAM